MSKFKNINRREFLEIFGGCGCACVPVCLGGKSCNILHRKISVKVVDNAVHRHGQAQ